MCNAIDCLWGARSACRRIELGAKSAPSLLNIMRCALDHFAALGLCDKRIMGNCYMNGTHSVRLWPHCGKGMSDCTQLRLRTCLLVCNMTLSMRNRWQATDRGARTVDRKPVRRVARADGGCPNHPLAMPLVHLWKRDRGSWARGPGLRESAQWWVTRAVPWRMHRQV